jgi:asparagine synthase (glutamine-hydrolysing)
MCGICGLVSLDGASSPDRAALGAMSETMVHRGPDSDGAIVDGPVGLAVRRLSIIDLEGGDQPIANEDRSVQVVQNGEIYNYRELRAELERRGHRFSTRSDTEVLVHLYEEQGPRFVDGLRGMFALALWDSHQRRLVLARDRFGIKPLYYRIAGPTLSFASELKALLGQPDFERQVDFDALEAFLAFNSIPAPLTIFSGVHKLPAGHLLTWEGSEPQVERYARPRPVAAADVRAEGDEELAAELRERLRDSVRAHLVADVPVGVLLSGGVDSSALTALAASESSERVSTFSIGFEESSFDELSAARLVAERYGTDHHELVIRPDAVELFGGYYTYVADQIAPRLAPAAKALRGVIERLPSSSAKASLDYKAKRFVRGAHLPPLERHHAWKEIFSDEARAELLARRRDGNSNPLDLYRARYRETEGAEPLARLQDLDLGIYLVDDLLVKTDRASMAHSLEARVPFCDPAVAELALALPTAKKVRGFAKKRLLRRAVAPLLPRSIVRAPKRGFSVPMAAWLRGELEPFARQVLAPETVARQGYFRSDQVSRLVDAHVAGREDLSRQIWGLMTFTLWVERYASSAVPIPA